MFKAKTRDNSIIFVLQTFIPDDVVLDDKDAPSAFAELRVERGEKSSPLFEPNVQTMAELIEVSYMVQTWGVEKTYLYLKEQVIPHLEEMHVAGRPEHHSVLIFGSSLAAEQKENEDVMLALNADLGPLTDIASCARCGATKVNRKVKQTRSADEGVTAIFTCPICKNTWNEN